jgi:hypothetical protein
LAALVVALENALERVQRAAEEAAARADPARFVARSALMTQTLAGPSTARTSTGHKAPLYSDVKISSFTPKIVMG